MLEEKYLKLDDLFYSKRLGDIASEDIYLNKRKTALAINYEGLQTISMIKDASIPMILCDLPYATTNNEWDSLLPLDKVFREFDRVLRPGGTVVLTASQPFTSQLIYKSLELNLKTKFRHEIIWVKSIGSGQLNINIMPLKMHESVLIFVKDGGKRTYNEEMESGSPYKIKRNIKSADCYGKQKEHIAVNEGYRRATSIWNIPNPRVKGGHPTQKPLELLQKAIRVYSNPGDVILDITAGSFSTVVAALKEERLAIGVELLNKYYKKGVEWVEKES